MLMIIETPAGFVTQCHGSATVIPRVGEKVKCTLRANATTDHWVPRAELLVVNVLYDFDNGTVYVTVEDTQ